MGTSLEEREPLFTYSLQIEEKLDKHCDLWVKFEGILV